MSKKMTDEQEAQQTPFFTHLLSSDADPASTSGGGGTKPTYPCVDTLCTKKYPSDDDESTTWFGDKD